MSVATQEATSRDWKKRETFSSAMVQVGVAAVLLAGGVFFVVHRGHARKDADEAVQAARQTAIRDNPSDVKAALDALAPETADNSPEALALAADLQTSLWLTHHVPGADAEARTLLTRAEATNARSEERFAAHALQLLGDGKVREAETYVDELRQKGASSPKLWFALGETYARAGQWALAKQAYTKSLEKGWKSPRLFAGAGEAWLSEGSVLNAMDALENGLKLNPEHSMLQLTFALARLHRGEKLPNEAALERELSKAAGTQTPGIVARQQTVRAEIALANGRFDDALTMVGDAVAAVPDEPFALWTKARILAASKGSGVAEAYRAAAAARKMAPATYFEGTNALLALGNADGANALLDDYEAAYANVVLTTSEGKSRPALEQDGRFWVARGNVRRAANKPAEAMEAYERGIAAGGLDSVRANQAKASLLLSQGKADAAIELLKPYTPDDGSGASGDAYLTMGESLFSKNELEAGCQHFAFGLAKLRRENVSKERLAAVLEDVNKKLLAAKQPGMAKAWMTEAKPLIQ